MKIKIIIEDVDVTVAQLLGLLGDNATVEIEQPPIKQTVEKTAEVVQPKKTEASKKVKKKLKMGKKKSTGSLRSTVKKKKKKGVTKILTKYQNRNEHIK